MSSTSNPTGFSRRDALKLGAAAVSSGAVQARAQGKSGDGPKRPNFVFFMTDGQRPDEFSYMAGKEATSLRWNQNPVSNLIHTPNMDRLAREGIWFQDAFVVNALCAPGRGTTLTGLYSRRNGVIDNKDRPLASGVKIISDYLHEAGYDVAFCGKSHIKGALRDHYWDYYFAYQMQGRDLNPSIAEGWHGEIHPDRVYRGYLDALVTDAAAGWLQGQRERPFCLFLWFKEPHGEGLRPRHLQNLYNGVSVPKPRTFDDDLKGYPGKPKAVVNADNKLGSFEYCASLEQMVKNHNANCVGADEYIGRVLDVLEKDGKLDDTVVIHTSDHGYFLGEWHLIDKRLMYEPSIRIPLMFRYPKLIKPGMFNDRMVLNLDIAPTILELAGVEVPSQIQGQSLVPFLKGEQPSAWRKDWYYSYYDYPGPNMVPKCHGVRTERYKLIEFYEEQPKERELYDLQTDPHELRNLYGDPRYRDVTQQLLHRLEELRQETGEA
ncbi:MAG TPA: sulfatase [Bryobacteraceae bacterium]